MSNSPPPTRAAFCEEFNEDAQISLPETRQTACTANTTAKRSKPDATRGKPLRDEFSDSGYSSHTAATLGSGDSSSLESRREAHPERPDDASAESNTTVKDGTKESKSRSQSPEKPSLQRTGSKSKGYDNPRRKDCECPECLERKAKGVIPPRVDTSRPDDTFAKPRQKDTLSPLSPQFQRPSQTHPAPEAPALRAVPAPARARASTSQAYSQARPISFHAGVMPDMSYLQQPAFVERPPMARYATASPFPPPPYPASQPSYFPPLQTVLQPQDFFAPVTSMTPPYGVQPRPRPLASARPQTMYYDMSPSFMEYTQPMYPPPRAPDRHIEQQSRRQQPSQPRQEVTESSDAHRMPPPPPLPRRSSKSRQEQRPVIRHAATTSAAYTASHQRSSIRGLDEEQYTSHPSSRKQSFEGLPRSRRPSLARPPRTSDEKVAQALQLEREMARMNIMERSPPSPNSKRRVSVYGHESLKDLEGSVEAYQASRSGRESTSVPTGDDMLRLIRKKTLPTSNSSDGGSRISGSSRASRDGSDIKSSQRPSNDLKKRDSNDEAFAMRIPKGANLNLQPGFEGRAISLRQSRDGDGDMELRIGERGRTGDTGMVGSRPALREKSGRRYSVIESQALMESEREPEPEPRKSISRRESVSRRLEDPRVFEKETGDNGHRRIVRERIITRTTDRNRLRSRSRYSGRDQNMF